MWVVVGVGLAAVAYVGTSLFFLLRPRWLRKRPAHAFAPAAQAALPSSSSSSSSSPSSSKGKHNTNASGRAHAAPGKRKRRRLHISHRGGGSERPENTMAAFEHAVAAGTDMLELDVFLTRDRKVVVSHDQGLGRLTGKDVDICRTDFADLPPYQRRIPQGHFSPPPDDTSAGRFCLLDDVFRAFPDTPIHLEIKQYTEATELVHATAGLIKQHGRADRTVWGSFSGNVEAECRALHPEIPRYFGVAGVAKLLALFYTGLLPFVPVKEACLSIPMPSSPRLFAGAAKRGWAARLALRAVTFLLESPVLFAHLQRRGIHVYLWVLNDDADFDRAYNKLGADGVMTDRPSMLASYLARPASR